MTNESAILGLLAELYQRNAALQVENQTLRQALTEARQQDPEPAPPVS